MSKVKEETNAPLEINPEKRLKFKYLPLADLTLGVRLREDLGSLAELKESIQQFGLLQPLVVDENKRIIAGGRRYMACHQLGIDVVPVVFKETVSKSHHHMLELIENIYRKQMSWQEECKGIYRVHKWNERQSIIGGAEWTQTQSARLLGVNQTSVSVSLKVGGILIRHPEHPCAQQPTITEALRVIVQERQTELEKESLRRSVGASKHKEGKVEKVKKVRPDTGLEGEPLEGDEEPEEEIDVDALLKDEAPEGLIEIQNSVDLSHRVIHGDCIAVMKEMPDGYVDHILTDPPYAIDLENFISYGEGAGSLSLTGIEDTHQVPQNLELLKAFFQEAYRITRPASYVISFACITNFELCKQYALAAGFKVQDWPLIWHKPNSSLNRMAGINFTKNYEVAVVARRENATLQVNGPKAVISLDATRQSQSGLGLHPFIKPFGLWFQLLHAIACPGQRILDPFAGVGSSIEPILVADCEPIAIEIDERHYLSLVHNVKNFYSDLAKKPLTFVGAPTEETGVGETP